MSSPVVAQPNAAGEQCMRHTRIIVTHYGGPDALRVFTKTPMASKLSYSGGLLSKLESL